MRIKIKVFASIRDICGFSEKELIVSDSIKVNEVMDLFIKGNQELSDKKDSLLIAVNEEYCSIERILEEGDTLAIFPLLAAADMKLVLTQKEIIDLNAVSETGATHGDGSDLIFIGKVRDTSRGKKVTHIDYEIYNEMAVKELNRIADEAAADHEISRIIIIHRYGRVTLGETSILILVSSPHRDSSYQASRYIIDEIKKRVPIWKKEFYDDGSEWITDRS